MKVLILVIAVVAFVSSLPTGEVKQKLNLTPRIVDGEDAERRQFPYMLSLQSYGSHFCGASIIAPQVALTAAHCVYSGQTGVVAVAGLLDQGEANSDNQASKVIEIIQHPGYDGRYNDIAILKLETPFIYNDAVQPIGLPAAAEDTTGQVVLSGWGRISVIPSQTATRLQFLEMPVITNGECISRFDENGAFPSNIISSQLCTLPNRPHQSGCHGDSGGPLVQNGKLVGLVHGGDGYCGALLGEESPNVFTRISSFIDFIDTNASV